MLRIEREEVQKFVQNQLRKEYIQLLKSLQCYDSRLKELSDETTLVLSNIRELDRVPSTK